MTNFEKIKKMDIQEVANLLCETHMDCSTCRFHHDCEETPETAEGIINWLSKESDE